MKPVNLVILVRWDHSVMTASKVPREKMVSRVSRVRREFRENREMLESLERTVSASPEIRWNELSLKFDHGLINDHR